MAGIGTLIPLDDDGLPTPEIGAGGEDKYRHVQLYASLFINRYGASGTLLCIWIYLQAQAGLKFAVRQKS